MRQTVYLNQHTLDIVEKAKTVWPETGDNVSEIIRKIIADWDRIREGGGGRMTQLSTRLDRHEMLLMLICQKLGIEGVDVVDASGVINA